MPFDPVARRTVSLLTGNSNTVYTEGGGGNTGLDEPMGKWLRYRIGDGSVLRPDFVIDVWEENDGGYDPFGESGHKPIGSGGKGGGNDKDLQDTPSDSGVNSPYTGQGGFNRNYEPPVIFTKDEQDTVNKIIADLVRIGQLQEPKPDQSLRDFLTEIDKYLDDIQNQKSLEGMYDILIGNTFEEIGILQDAYSLLNLLIPAPEKQLKESYDKLKEAIEVEMKKLYLYVAAYNAILKWIALHPLDMDGIKIMKEKLEKIMQYIKDSIQDIKNELFVMQEIKDILEIKKKRKFRD